jgi:hypothetical protein
MLMDHSHTCNLPVHRSCVLSADLDKNDKV